MSNRSAERQRLKRFAKQAERRREHHDKYANPNGSPRRIADAEAGK